MTTKAEILRMIRRNCIACMGDQPSLVPDCTSRKCEFFDFRMGKDPCPNPNKQKAGRLVSKFNEKAAT